VARETQDKGDTMSWWKRAKVEESKREHRITCECPVCIPAEVRKAQWERAQQRKAETEQYWKTMAELIYKVNR